MMDRNYPTSSFTDQLAPSAQTAAWAYERTTASIKTSLSYGATQSEPESHHRQTFVSTQQPPTYSTAHLPTGVSGTLDTSLHAAGSNTTDTSILSFLSAIESRAPQAAPVTAPLLSHYRTPSWQMGVNTTPAMELFVTGALPTTGLFPTPPALSSCQLPSTFRPRGFVTPPSLTLQDTAFNPSNSLLTPHHPLLQLKSSPAAVPATLAFDRLVGTVPSAGVPPQSSTYRSAQESAPHLLLPSAHAGSQQNPQPYSALALPGSVGKVLQRECSVIKHHQRPSSTQSVQAQHSLHGYLAGGGELPFQAPSQPPCLPCSPLSDSTQVSNGGLSQKTSQGTLEQTQAFSFSIPSPGFPAPSGVKAKDFVPPGSDEHAQPSREVAEPPADSPDMQHKGYLSPNQKQGSGMASQPQTYPSVQPPGPMSVSSSLSYVTSQALSDCVGHSQVYSSSQSKQLPSLCRTLTSCSGQSGSPASVSQSLVYSPSQQQGLHPVGRDEEYGAQELCSGSHSQSYSSSHSQGLPSVTYSAQSQELATACLTQSYAAGQSTSMTSQPLSYSSTRAHTLPTSSSSQDYVLMSPCPGGKMDIAPSPEPQKHLPPLQSPTFSTASHSLSLQNHPSSSDLKPSHSTRKSDLFVSKQEGGEFPLQNFAQLQSPCQPVTGGGTTVQNNVVYVVSKMDDRYNSPGVIRSSLRQEDQTLDPGTARLIKDERIGSIHCHAQHMTGANIQVTSETKDSSLSQSSHSVIRVDELKQHFLQHRGPELRPLNQTLVPNSQPQDQCQAMHPISYIRLPSNQVMVEPSQELQMILMQQSLLSSGLDPSKLSPQMQQVPVQYLRMDETMTTVDGGQQQAVLPQNSAVLKIESMSSKLLPQHEQNQHDTKHPFNLSSICFTDSMLLADERNILSNVDDILAATAAACGVTPQDFVKATASEAEMPLLGSPMDSKAQLVYQHNPSNLSSQYSTVANVQTMTMTLNGSQIMGVQQLPKGAVLEHQALELASSQAQSVPTVNLHVQSGSTNPSFVSRHVMGEKAESPLWNPGSTSHHSEEGDEKAPEDDAMNDGSGVTFYSSGLVVCDSVGEEGLVSNAKLSQSKDQIQHRGPKIIKMEDDEDGCSKRKSKLKVSTNPMADENGQLKPLKRYSHGKRRNSRGSDTNSPSGPDSVCDGYQQHERMRQKIREVEEKQPEVKTGFIGSFLDFLKSGPKQQFSSPPVRMPNRSKKSSRRPPCPLTLPSKSVPLAVTPDSGGTVGPCKRMDEELKKNLETLPSFSSDEDESVGKNLQKSITSALCTLDEPSEKNKLGVGGSPLHAVVKPQQSSCMPPSALKKREESQIPSADQPAQKLLTDVSSGQLLAQGTVMDGSSELLSAHGLDVPPEQLAVQLTSVAIEGLTDEDQSDSGGEGMYRERDEFVVKIEDIESLKVTLSAGREPPAIWKVQKALLQKFVPELREGRRVFSATNSYLGYFGDAKTMYRRVYVKFMDTVNKREYVRVCNRKPRCKPLHSIRGSQAKTLLKAVDPATPKPVSTKPSSKPRPKPHKDRAEAPPKKRKKWKQDFSSLPSESSPEALSEDDEFTPPVPFVTRFLNTRTMKETFKSYVELLISVALDGEMIDELLLPHMKKVDGMITDYRRRLLPKLRVGQLFKNALDSFPEFSLVTELKKDGESPSLKVRLTGKAYNKKNMRPSNAIRKLPLEYTVEKEKTQVISLYHSLQHYKYHTYLMCKDEIASLRTRSEDLGQEDTVQRCMQDAKWVESLFSRFGELLTQVQQTLT